GLARTVDELVVEAVPVDEVAGPVRHHDGHFGMVEDGRGRKVIGRVVGQIPPSRHPETTPRGSVRERTTGAPATVSARGEWRISRMGSAPGHEDVRRHVARNLRERVVRVTVTW